MGPRAVSDKGASGGRGAGRGADGAPAAAEGAGDGREAPRRGRFTSAAETLRRTLRESAARRGFAEPKVLTHWPEIVGARLAGLATPVRVTYPRGSGLGATLVVHAEGARAPEVEHLGPQIVERVNRFYGYRAISRVRVVQTAPTPAGFAEAAPGWKGPEEPPEPGPEERAEAARLAAAIRDEELRLALTRVGAHILARRRRGRPEPAPR